jgi:hypothetical protein
MIRNPSFDIRSEWDGSEVDVSEFSIKSRLTGQVPVLGLEHGSVPDKFSGY